MPATHRSRRLAEGAGPGRSGTAAQTTWGHQAPTPGDGWGTHTDLAEIPPPKETPTNISKQCWAFPDTAMENSRGRGIAVVLSNQTIVQIIPHSHFSISEIWKQASVGWLAPKRQDAADFGNPLPMSCSGATMSASPATSYRRDLWSIFRWNSGSACERGEGRRCTDPYMACLCLCRCCQTVAPLRRRRWQKDFQRMRRN